MGDRIGIFVHMDIVFILLSTIIYLLYSFIKRVKTDVYIKFLSIFISSYFSLFYMLSFHLSASETKGLFMLFLLPVLTLSHTLIPFNKNKRFNRFLIIGTCLYLALLLCTYIAHYFSDM